MAVTRDDLAKLILLQDSDKRCDALRREIDKYPERIGAVRAEIEGEKSRLNDVNERSKRLLADRKERENEMAAKEAAIKKHEGELNQVKTNEAYKALLKEIEDDKKAIGDLETKILELMDEADKVLTEKKGIESEISGFEKERLEKIQALEAEKASVEGELEAAQAARGEVSASVPDELRKLYDDTRRRRAGVAVSLLHESSCAVCHMSLPPQTVLNVKKGNRVEQCDSCQRIVILPPGAPASAKGA